MKKLTEGKLSFNFPDKWNVIKYDECSFYKKKFQKVKGGKVKAVDFIAISPEKTLWLIEVKDYRENQRTKPSDLPLEIAEKVFDTLAGLLPATLSEFDYQKIAQNAIKAKKIRIVFHLEQRSISSKLFPQIYKPADIQVKMRQYVKSIDSKPYVVNKGYMKNLGWTVS